MILETTVIDINGTKLVRIPASAVDFFKIKNKSTPFTCKLEEISDTELRIIF